MGRLFDRLICTENLILAFRKARKNKLLKPATIEYSKNLKQNLRILQNELKSGVWKPSPLKYFEIYEPKRRQIGAAPFGDRVVHHALINVLEPILEKFQIFHSYACRPGKGSHAAVKMAYQNQRKYKFVLKMDIQKYFQSIPQVHLLKLLGDKIWDAEIYALLERLILNHSGGIPIGNLTSQHFANFYLAHLDHYVLQELRPKAYVRYMDDFCLWVEAKDQLKIAKNSIEFFLKQSLKLSVKASATELNSSSQGIVFLGFRILPWQIRLAARSKRRLMTQIKEISKVFEKIGDWEVNRRIYDSIWGFVSHAHLHRFKLDHIFPLLNLKRMQ